MSIIIEMVIRLLQGHSKVFESQGYLPAHNMTCCKRKVQYVEEYQLIPAVEKEYSCQCTAIETGLTADVTIIE